MTTRSAWLLALGGLMFAGCFEDPDLADEGLGSDTQDLARWDPQSDRMTGAIDGYDGYLGHDTFNYNPAVAEAPAGNPARSGGRGFTTPLASGTYLDLPGVRPRDGARLVFRVSPGSADGVRSRYRVQVRLASETSFREYCESPTAHAYALPGHFEWTGRYYYELTGEVTFVCPRGGVAKALRWSYGGSNTRLSAATAMARADFCGSGKPHTVEGTPILFGDVTECADGCVTTSGPPPAGDYQLEAAWVAADSAEFGVAARAMCISKWRYQSLAAEECETTLPDPRKTSEFSEGRYCDDYASLGIDDPGILPALAAEGALMFSWSRVDSDVGVWEWQVPGVQRWLVTDQGSYEGYYSAVRTECPPQLASCEAKPRLRAAAFTSARTGTVPLVLYRTLWASPTRYRTSTDATIDDVTCSGLFCFSYWTAVRTVGHVYATSASTRPRSAVRLSTYHKDGEYRLFRAGESTAGWTFVRAEGYSIH